MAPSYPSVASTGPADDDDHDREAADHHELEVISLTRNDNTEAPWRRAWKGVGPQPHRL